MNDKELINERTLKGIYNFLMLEGNNSKGLLLSELIKFGSSDLENIENEIKKIRIEKQKEERK